MVCFAEMYVHTFLPSPVTQFERNQCMWCRERVIIHFIFSCHWAKQASVLFRRQVLSSLGLSLALCYIFSSLRFWGKMSRTSQHILGEILTDTLCSGTATSITCCMLGLPQHLSHMHFTDNSWYNCSYPKYPASSFMRPTNWSANVVILSPEAHDFPLLCSPISNSFILFDWKETLTK